MNDKLIVDCVKENIDTVCEIDRTGSNYNWTKSMFLAELENKNSFFKVLFADNKIAGYIIYHIIIDEAEILNIVIDNKFKRQNLGKYLLEQTLNDISKQNVKTVFLEVGEKNIPAINLYLKFGFKQYNTRNNYYKNGENAILMKKTICSI
ncbi:MAG: ribosomal protein S18-alanine N-acetyltransferase [Elusimicrobia bacterium]|nr:ribosomal protein S18-alanine N-acetyltransferase [Elusimicrobiota bacterium]